MNTKVQFCGDMRKFKRCPNRALVDYQKTIEDIQSKLTPLAERTRNFQFRVTELEDEKEAIDKHIELLEKLEDASDDEIRECIDLTKKKISIQKEIHHLRVENDNQDIEDRKVYGDLDDELRGAYGKFAHIIFEDFDEDDMDEADTTDLTVAPRLSELYRLATSGATQKDIDKAYKKIIQDSFS